MKLIAIGGAAAALYALERRGIREPWVDDETGSSSPTSIVDGDGRLSDAERTACAEIDREITEAWADKTEQPRTVLGVDFARVFCGKPENAPDPMCGLVAQWNDCEREAHGEIGSTFRSIGDGVVNLVSDAISFVADAVLAQPVLWAAGFVAVAWAVRS